MTPFLLRIDLMRLFQFAKKMNYRGHNVLFTKMLHKTLLKSKYVYMCIFFSGEKLSI